MHAGKVKQAQCMMHDLAQQHSLSAVLASQNTQATQGALGLAEHLQRQFTSELAALVATEQQALASLRATHRSTQQAAQQAVSNARSKLDNFQSDLQARQDALRSCEGLAL
jgi:hypothetical protein